MSYGYSYGYQEQPRLGATFYPGSTDDYYMPEVISPAPQRIMPEVPGNMQDNLAHMEGHAGAAYPNRMSSLSQQSSAMNTGYAQYGGAGVPYSHPAYNDPNNAQQATHPPTSEPSFSHFPKLENPPPNVPLSDDDKEYNLESVREQVLNSNDPEAQLAWAQDALTYVEISAQNEEQEAEIRGARPQTPHVERQLRTDAMEVVGFLAEQEHPRALFIKGMWLEFGKFGCAIDKKEAFRCYKKSADKGYARANYRIGMQFETTNDSRKAIEYYEAGRSAGDSASNYRLGMMYLLGQCGQPQDYNLGIQLIRYAAETADENAPQGAYVYGMLQAKELPQIDVPNQYLPEDMLGARVNLEKAAFLGFAKAQVRMGSAYELCRYGCEFNPRLSLHYNSLAARQGDADAEMAVSKWFLCGYEGVFEKNDELAYNYAKRAAQSGLHTAEFAMGYFNEVGIHVSPNLQEAHKWYAKAAEHGNKDAVGRLDGISRHRTLSRKDHEQVALAKIKSQYGSKRGQRPARFQNAPPMPQLPTVIDEAPLEMPDPSQLSLNDGPTPRPATTTPYPMQGEFGPPQQQLHTQSSFGFSPNPRPNSVATTGGMPEPPHGRPDVGPPRPYSSVDNVRPGQRPPGRQMPPGPGGRRPMGPPGPQKPMGPSSMPPGHRNPAQRPPGAPGPQRMDIGYSAPPEQGRPRPNQNRVPMQGQGPQQRRPSVPGGFPADRVQSPQSRPATGSAAHVSPNQGRASTMPANTGGQPAHPSRQSSQASTHTPRPASQPQAQMPQKSQTPKPQASAGQGLPGKGPKTFTEMGVPMTKNDGDCCVM